MAGKRVRFTRNARGAIRPAFAALFVLVGAVGLWLDPVIVLWLAGLFGAAILLQRSDTRG
jgi:hypothetical protein